MKRGNDSSSGYYGNNCLYLYSVIILKSLGRMKICKLFIASSMKNFLRSELDSIEDEVNIDLESRGLEVRCEVVAYSHRPIVDCESDTQEVINDIAAKSDIFILIANNSDVIGKYTMQELDTAESQYKNSGAPLIKAFVAKVGRDDAVSVSYRDVNELLRKIW